MQKTIKNAVILAIYASIFGTTLAQANPIEDFIGGGFSSSPSGKNSSTTPKTPSNTGALPGPKEDKDKSCETALTAAQAVELAMADILGDDPADVKSETKSAPPENADEILAGVRNVANNLYEELPVLAKAAIDKGPVKHQIENPDEFTTSLQSINDFFKQLDKIYFERDDLIPIMKASLITRSAILIVGPGGTAKSEIADDVGENLIDSDGKTNFFQLQMAPDTSISEVMGGVIAEKMLEGEMVRQWKKGVLGSKYVFLDEFFDARLKFLRSFLKAFHERKYTQGQIVEAGETLTFVAATNKYINEIYEKSGDNDPQALIDRFQFIYYAPGVLQDMQSIFGILNRQKGDLGKMKFEGLEIVNKSIKNLEISPVLTTRYFYIFNSLRRLLKAKEVSSMEEYRKALDRGEHVQLPYKSTRIFSPRSFVIGARLLPFMALERMTDKGVNRYDEIEYETEDIDMLAAKYLIMQGPKGENLERLIEDETNPAELAQLDTLKIESEALQEVLDDLGHEESHWIMKINEIRTAIRSNNPNKIRNALIPVLDEASNAIGSFERTEDVSATQTAALQALVKIYADPEISPYLRNK